jgi:two-component system OmpR family response regulator
MTTMSCAALQEQYNGTKLLIVDDDPMTCQLLKIQLEMEGYACTTLSDPERILEAIRTEFPSLALLDFHLGACDGLDLLQAIRSREECQSLPVVIMSGLDHRQDSELAGANGFMLKPFNLEDLVALIQEVLEREAA